MSILFALSLMFTQAPVDKAPPPWEQLNTAAAHYALGQDAKAQALLSPLEAKGGSPAHGARALRLASHICAGKIPLAKSALTEIKTQKKGTITLIASKLGSFPFMTAPKKTALLTKIAPLFDTLNLRLCHHLGKLYVAELIQPGLTGATAQKLDEWAVAYLKIAPTADYRLFGPYIAFRILAQKKYDLLFSGAPMTLEEKAAYDHYIDQGHLPFEGIVPWRFSALIPLTGRYRSIGKQMLLAIIAAKANWPGLEVVIHDTASSPVQALNVFKEQVLKVDHPIALLLPPDRASTALLLQQGSTLPMLSIGSPAKGSASSTTFFAQLTRAQQAAALARTAMGRGVKRFAIIYPDKAYGTTFATHFATAVTSLGGKIVKKIPYKFKKMPSRFNLKGVEGVFVPDAASRVELVARLMAASGHFAKPWNTTKRKGMMLLATAAGLSPRTLRNSARYLKGALFAPGYFGLKSEVLPAKMATWGVNRVLVHAYETWNYYSLIYTAVKGGALSHATLIRSLRQLSAGPGLGPLFGAKGHPRRPARLYEVRKATLHPIDPL